MSDYREHKIQFNILFKGKLTFVDSFFTSEISELMKNLDWLMKLKIPDIDSEIINQVFINAQDLAIHYLKDPNKIDKNNVIWLTQSIKEIEKFVNNQDSQSNLDNSELIKLINTNKTQRRNDYIYSIGSLVLGVLMTGIGMAMMGISGVATIMFFPTVIGGIFGTLGVIGGASVMHKGVTLLDKGGHSLFKTIEKDKRIKLTNSIESIKGLKKLKQE